MLDDGEIKSKQEHKSFLQHFQAGSGPYPASVQWVPVFFSGDKVVRV
jgi:hypothetical protein